MSWTEKLRAVAPNGRDLHIYGGLVLFGWGLRSSPYPWGGWLVVGLALWYMGVFRLSQRNRE